MVGLSDSLVRIVNQSGAYRRRSGNTRLIADGRELFLTVGSVKAREPQDWLYYAVLRRGCAAYIIASRVIIAQISIRVILVAMTGIRK